MNLIEIYMFNAEPPQRAINCVQDIFAPTSNKPTWIIGTLHLKTKFRGDDDFASNPSNCLSKYNFRSASWFTVHVGDIEKIHAMINCSSYDVPCNVLIDLTAKVIASNPDS